ncbi:hypothetical protein FB107DRAFT_280400 [Schizophyllum commune]
MSNVLRPSKTQQAPGQTFGPVDEAAESEDEYDVADPGFLLAARDWSFDNHPGPGYCATPFMPHHTHSLNGRDVRWEKDFTTYFLVRSSRDRAGGVYTTENDMNFALQGLHPPPPHIILANFHECQDLWKVDCRAGVHGHPGPPSVQKSPSPAKSSIMRTIASAELMKTPTNSPRSASPSIFRSGSLPRQTRHTDYRPCASVQSGEHAPKPPPPSPATPSKAPSSLSPLNPATPPRSVGVAGTSPTAMAGTPAPVVRPPLTPSTGSPRTSFITTRHRNPYASPARTPAGVSVGSLAPRPSGLGPSVSEGSRPPFIQPVWFARDPQGQGVILTNNYQYARELHAEHGNIDLATDVDQLHALHAAPQELETYCPVFQGSTPVEGSVSQLEILTTMLDDARRLASEEVRLYACAYYFDFYMIHPALRDLHPEHPLAKDRSDRRR